MWHIICYYCASGGRNSGWAHGQNMWWRHLDRNSGSWVVALLIGMLTDFFLRKKVRLKFGSSEKCCNFAKQFSGEREILGV